MLRHALKSSVVPAMRQTPMLARRNFAAAPGGQIIGIGMRRPLSLFI